MPLPKLLALVVAFFLTSVISVVTGSTSLITVPVMIQCGIEPHAAVATNMFALIFLSAGGLAPLWRSQNLPSSRLPLMTTLTVLGSVGGAMMLNSVPVVSLRLIIAVLTIAVALFSLARRDLGSSAASQSAPSGSKEVIGYMLTFALAVYGGFFSGGYITLLTAVFTIWFHMTFVESIAATKLMNVFSSLVATGVFAWRGLVDFKLGLLLGVSAFVGGTLGAKIALKLNALWLRRIFVLAVLALAVTLVSSVSWQ